MSACRRRIRPPKYEDFEASNIVERRVVRNTRGFQLPVCNTEQYSHSFVQTVMDWNHLEEEMVRAGSVSSFTSALGRTTSPEEILPVFNLYYVVATLLTPEHV